MAGGHALIEGKQLFQGGSEEKPTAKDRQREKRRLTAAAALLLPDEGVAKCGRKVSRSFETEIGGAYVAGVRHTDGASLAGVVSCHSVWHCPTCAARIALGRRKEVGGLVALHQSNGGRVTMTTLTLRHDRRTPIKTVKDDVTGTWSKMRGTRAFKDAERFGGVVGGVKSLEITFGENGPHPHLHVLTFFAAGFGDPAVEAYQEKLLALWIEKAAARGYICERGAQDWRFADSGVAAGEYVTKWGVDWELTHAHLKKGKGGRSPFQVLADHLQMREPQDAAIFRDYAKAFKGARQLTWFGKIRELLKAPELSDDEVATDEETSETVCFIDASAFHELRRRGLLESFLEIIAAGGAFGKLTGAVGVNAWFAVKHIPADVRPPEFAARFRRPRRKVKHDQG